MYDNVTVIPADTLIRVNGVPLWFTFPAPANVHAVQWHDGSGHVEYVDGAVNKELTEKEYAAEVAPYIALWQAEKARLEAEQARLEQEANRPPTPEEQLAAFTAAIQGYLDDFARTRNYDGILSVCTYATSTVEKFRAEGQYAVEARDAVWATGYKLMADVQAGKRPMPTLEEVIAELPKLAWPGLANGGA